MYGEGFPYLGEDVAVNVRLSGPGQRWLRHGAVLGGYVCLAALAIALGLPANAAWPAQWLPPLPSCSSWPCVP